MELRHLRYFVAAAEEEHFGRGAKRVNVVQPALTRTIRELERELGVELFERLPRGVRLTSAGQVFLADARGILSQTSHAADRARRAARGQIGALIIGFVEGVNYHPVFRDAIARFRREHDGIELGLLPGNSAAQWNRLSKRKVQVAIVQSVPANPAFRAEVAFEDHLMLVLPPRSSFSSRSKLSITVLNELPLVWFKREWSPEYFDSVARALDAAGVKPNVVKTVSSHIACGSLVAAGVGASLIPSFMASLLPPGLQLVPVVDFPAKAVAHALWRADDSSPALVALLNSLSAARSSQSARSLEA